MDGGAKSGPPSGPQRRPSQGWASAACAHLPLPTANLIVTLAILLAHLAFLTDDPADGPVSEETRIARLREQFAFLDPGVTVTIRDGVAHIARPPAAAVKADEATKLYERAGKRARGGDFVGAVKLYQRVLTLNPALPSAHRDLAMSLMELGRPAEAWALNALATTLARTGHPAAALARFDEGIAAHPDFPHAWPRHRAQPTTPRRPDDSVRPRRATAQGSAPPSFRRFSPPRG